MFVLTAVSSIKTRRVVSSSPYSRIQRWRARTTSARSCSDACRTLFERDAVTLKKAKQRGPATKYPALVHRIHNLIQRPITLLIDKGHNFFGMVLQRRAAPAAGLGFIRSGVPPCLMPAHRRADADTEAFRRFMSRRSLVNRFDHTSAQIR